MAKHRRPRRGQRRDAGLATDLAREHEPSVNQVRHEPLPASRHDERGPGESRRDDEAAAGGASEHNAADRPQDPGRDQDRDADEETGDDRGSGR
jgi:hypothetical protein